MNGLKLLNPHTLGIDPPNDFSNDQNSPLKSPFQNILCNPMYNGKYWERKSPLCIELFEKGVKPKHRKTPNININGIKNNELYFNFNFEIVITVYSYWIKSTFYKLQLRKLR